MKTISMAVSIGILAYTFGIYAMENECGRNTATKERAEVDDDRIVSKYVAELDALNLNHNLGGLPKREQYKQYVQTCDSFLATLFAKIYKKNKYEIGRMLSIHPSVIKGVIRLRSEAQGKLRGENKKVALTKKELLQEEPLQSENKENNN